MSRAILHLWQLTLLLNPVPQVSALCPGVAQWKFIHAEKYREDSPLPSSITESGEKENHGPMLTFWVQPWHPVPSEMRAGLPGAGVSVAFLFHLTTETEWPSHLLTHGRSCGRSKFPGFKGAVTAGHPPGTVGHICRRNLRASVCPFPVGKERSHAVMWEIHRRTRQGSQLRADAGAHRLYPDGVPMRTGASSSHHSPFLSPPRQKVC